MLFGPKQEHGTFTKPGEILVRRNKEYLYHNHGRCQLWCAETPSSRFQRLYAVTF
jgi:hypothetical protein